MKKFITISVLFLSLPLLAAAQFSINENIFIGENGTLHTDLDTRVLTGNALINDSGTLSVGTDTDFILSDQSILLNRGVVQGDVTFEKDISRPDFENTEPDGRWLALSSPAGGNYTGNEGLLRNLWTQGFPGADYEDTNFDPNVVEFTNETGNRHCFEEPDENWCAPETNSLTAGQGFFVYLFENKVPGDNSTAVDFTEPLSIMGKNKTFDGATIHTFPNLIAEGEGWNFLGNQFGAPLDWSSSDWSKNQLTEFAYIWDPEEKQYLVTSDDGSGNTVLNEPILAPFQAFWVKTTDGATSPELLMTNGVFTTADDNTEYFKEQEIPVASLSLDIGDYRSKTAFRFGDQYETGFNDDDAHFLTPMAHSFAYLYTYNDGNPTYLKSLPETIESKIEMPLYAGGFENLAPYSGEATIKMEGFGFFSQEWEVALYDHRNGTVTDLTQESEYRFTIRPESQQKVESLNRLMKPGTPKFKSAETESPFTLVIDPNPGLDEIADLPANFALQQNYPNPFNPTTVISYELPQQSSVQLMVYDMSGRQVATLVNEQVSAGVHEVNFDASALSSGVYMYRLQAGGQIITKKLTLIK